MEKYFDDYSASSHITRSTEDTFFKLTKNIPSTGSEITSDMSIEEITDVISTRIFEMTIKDNDKIVEEEPDS